MTTKTYSITSYMNAVAGDSGWDEVTDLPDLRSALKALYAFMKKYGPIGMEWTPVPNRAYTFTSNGMTVALETWYHA